jgi:UDP-N-acetylglucosamine/UDP-N-acetylgalactosamine 4-epimerase
VHAGDGSGGPPAGVSLPLTDARMTASTYEQVRAQLRSRPRTWLVTGAAGFIGSHLLEHLLALGQRVVALDNLSTGSRENLDQVRSLTGRDFRFVEGDIRDAETCVEACEGADVVLHHAALGSVPRSIDDPLATHASNVDGFLHVLEAARRARVGRFVYATSSSTYGDDPGLPKVEDRVGTPLSPYAVSKRVNELYAGVFQRTYGIETIGLRYFNVFGARQDPAGPYAAVVPRWAAALVSGGACVVHGDGSGSRDFCYVENVVQANLLAAVAAPERTGEVYNVAVGQRTTLLELFALMRAEVARTHPSAATAEPHFGPRRSGDIPHSLADIGKAVAGLGYQPSHSVRDGLREAVPWYVAAETARLAETAA